MPILLRRASFAEVLLAVSLVACGGAAPTPSAAPSSAANVSEDAPAEPLTNGTKRLLGALKGPLRIDVYISRGDSDIGPIERAVAALLEQYRADANGNFSFSMLDPRAEAERKRAEELGLLPLPGSDPSKPPASSPGHVGLAFTYQTLKHTLPPIDPGGSLSLEFWISTKIRELEARADGLEYRLGVVAGKGAIDPRRAALVQSQGEGPQPNISSVIEKAFPFYELESLDLKGGDAVIDPGLHGIIITQPGEAYSEQELRRIDQFVMLGGKGLLIFASAVSLRQGDAKLAATLDLHGLEALMSGYGIDMQRDAVLDFGAHFELQTLSATGQVPLGYPPIARVAVRAAGGTESENGSRLPLFGIVELAVPFPSSLELAPGRQPPDVTFTTLAKSTRYATTLTREPVDLAPRKWWRPMPPFAERIVAASVEGRLASAFRAPGASGILANDRAPAPSRVLVVASSQFLANPFIRASGDAAASDAARNALLFAGPYATEHLAQTILAFKSTLDWATAQGDLTEATSRRLRLPASSMNAEQTSKPGRELNAPDVIPVDTDDATWGSPTAPLTLVEFADLECEHSARVQPILAELSKRYGLDTLRLVFKHRPLPTHPHAFEAAALTQSVQDITGSEAAMSFMTRVFAAPRASLGREAYDRWLVELGLDPPQVMARAKIEAIQSSVVRDIALARHLGVTTTPVFFLNGIRLSGAPTLQDFVTIADAQRQRANALLAHGTDPRRVHALLVAENFEPPGAPLEHIPPTAP